MKMVYFCYYLHLICFCTLYMNPCILLSYCSDCILSIVAHTYMYILALLSVSGSIYDAFLYWLYNIAYIIMYHHMIIIVMLVYKVLHPEMFYTVLSIIFIQLALLFLSNSLKLQCYDYKLIW